MKTSFKKFITSGLLIGSMLLAQPVFAQSTYTPLEPLPCIPGGGVTCAQAGAIESKPFNFENYVQYVFNLVIAVAAAAAVFMIVYGGFQYMTTESWTGKGDSIKKVRGALTGLLLVLTSFLILRTIDPRLVAIPTTLVKPLDLAAVYSQSKTAVADFMADLDKQAATYHVDITDVKAKAASLAADTQTNLNAQADAEQKIMKLQNLTDVNQVANLCGNLPDGASTALTSLCAERKIAQLKAMTSAGENRLVIAQGKMDVINAQCAGSNSASCFSGLMDQVTGIMNDTSALLQPDQKQRLQAYAAYTQDVLYINSEVADLNEKGITLDHSIDKTSTRGKNLISVMDALNNSVTSYSNMQNADPAILSTMKQHQKDLQATVDHLLFGK